jgi:hypothetical protein
MVTVIELSSKTKDPITETIKQQDDSAVLLPAQSESSSDEEQESPKKSSGGNKTEDTNASSRPRAMSSLFDDQDDEEDTTSQTHNPRSRKDGERHHQASFDIETSPTKRRRLTSSEPHVWDGFVRKGARLKGFLDDALHLVATGFQQSDDDSSSSEKRIEEAPTPRQSRGNHAADIAREKTAECMILQKVSANKQNEWEYCVYAFSILISLFLFLETQRSRGTRSCHDGSECLSSRGSIFFYGTHGTYH